MTRLEEIYIRNIEPNLKTVKDILDFYGNLVVGDYKQRKLQEYFNSDEYFESLILDL